MKEKIILECPELPGLILESIDETHLELIRGLKNGNQASFFHREAITEEEQLAWFGGYLERPDDLMFVFELEGEPLGCIGFRLDGETVDLYNFIRGEGGPSRVNVTVPMFDTLCRFAFDRHGLPIRGKVIEGNSIQRWVEKRGFRAVERGERDGLTYLTMELPLP